MGSGVSFCQHQITQEWPGMQCRLLLPDPVSHDKGTRLGRMAAGGATLGGWGTHRMPASQCVTHHPTGARVRCKEERPRNSTE